MHAAEPAQQFDRVRYSDRRALGLSNAQTIGIKKAPPGGRGEVRPATLKMASALPRLELGRSGSLDGLHFVEFALPLCACGACPRAIAAKAPPTRVGETDLSAAPAI